MCFEFCRGVRVKKLDTGLQSACDDICPAAAGVGGCHLVAFGEGLLPGYPFWIGPKNIMNPGKMLAL